MSGPGARRAAEPDDRRTFLKRVTGATALLTSARWLALAELPAEEGPKGEPLRVGVVGCGPWGREILETLARAPWAKVVAVCDTYPAFLKRAQELAPAAKAVAGPGLLGARFPAYSARRMSTVPDTLEHSA